MSNEDMEKAVEEIRNAPRTPMTDADRGELAKSQGFGDGSPMSKEQFHEALMKDPNTNPRLLILNARCMHCGALLEGIVRKADELNDRATQVSLEMEKHLAECWKADGA